jgi:hypothetical protein
MEIRAWKTSNSYMVQMDDSMYEMDGYMPNEVNIYLGPVEECIDPELPECTELPIRIVHCILTRCNQ